MSPLSFDQFPPEILFRVVRHLDIPDILRLRRASRYLNKVGRSREVWTDAYRNADFVHPPGPFTSQSTLDLERTLVSCFRADRNLHAKETSARRLRDVCYKGKALRVSLVFGRFLLLAFRREVCCYDLDLDEAFKSGDEPESDADIIYASTDGTIESVCCASAVDVEGRPFACMVLKEATGQDAELQTRISVYSLNVTEQPGLALSLIHCSEYNGVFDIYSVDLGPRVIAIQGRVGGLVFKDLRFVVLDVRTRTQLLLPRIGEFEWEEDEIPDWASTIKFTSISTSTHLILTRSFSASSSETRSVFMAFDLRRPNTSDERVVSLSLSHRGVIPLIRVLYGALFHDSIQDPFTQDTRVMIQINTINPYYPFSPLWKYGYLCLSGSRFHYEDVDKVGIVTFEPLGLLSALPPTRPSFNGTGRVFYTSKQGSRGTIAVIDFDVRCDGSAGSDERKAKVKHNTSVLWLPNQYAILDYDPYFGRLCLRSVMQAKYWVIETFDLAV